LEYNFYYIQANEAPPAYIIPIITPNNPKAEPKISITKILTKVSGV
jgi:hypothetical protein